MKNFSLKFILAITFLGMTTFSFAQGQKVITLRDGSVLNAKVIQLTDGVYTLETSTLGQINIPESDILSITAEEAVKPQENGTQGAEPSQKDELKSQVQAVQETILTDPAIVSEISDVVSDPEVQKILGDPTLFNDVMTYDQEKIQNNQGVQDLMKNPKVQELMNIIGQKIQPQK